MPTAVGEPRTKGNPGSRCTGIPARVGTRGEMCPRLHAAEGREPSADFRRLPDYVPYPEAADTALRDLRRQLEQLDLSQKRRVAFYPIGAAWALLLEETRPDWKRAYVEHPFTLPDLPSGR